MPASHGYNNGGHFLTGDEIRAIGQREIHYNAWSQSILDPYLQPFWRLVVTWVPLSVTPSTLSVCGLICNLVSTCVTIAFAPNLSEPLPHWVSISNAISIFLYQTFDAIDGKQCFRTQNCEIEEFADHAADSISTTLNAILLAAALQIGKSPLLGITHLMALSAFYGAHLAALVTNSLAFGSMGVSEAQWIMITIHLITGMGPSGMWTHVVLEWPMGCSFTAREVVGVGLIAVLVAQNYRNFAVAAGRQRTPLETHGVEIPRRSFSLKLLVPMSVLAMGYSICIKNGLLMSMAWPVMLIAGLSFAKASMRLMLEKFAKRRRYGFLVDLSTFCPFLLLASSYYGGGTKGRSEKIAWTLVLLLFADNIRFVALVMADLKHARDVNIFSMRKGPGENYPRDTGFYVAGENLPNVQKAWQEFAADEKRVIATYGPIVA